MSPSPSVAATLPPDNRQKLAIEVLAQSKPITKLAAEHQVSRQFLYKQGHKAKIALDEAFEPTTSDVEPVAFNNAIERFLASISN